MKRISDQQPYETHSKKEPIRLTRESIVESALHIADTEGIQALSFRRLAKDFDVTPMAIYRHVSNKEDLLNEMTEHMLASLDSTTDRNKNWLEQMNDLLYALRQVLLIHPSGSHLLSRRFLPSINGLQIFETVLDILSCVGFEPQEAYLIFEQLLNQVVSLVVAEAGYIQGSPEERRAWESRLLTYYGSLPQQQYPRLVEASPHIAACFDTDRHFKFGTDILLAGIEAMAKFKRI